MSWIIRCDKGILSLEAAEITIDLTGKEYLVCRNAQSSTISEIILTLGNTCRRARIVNLQPPTEIESGIQNYRVTFKLFGEVGSNVFKDK